MSEKTKGLNWDIPPFKVVNMRQSQHMRLGGKKNQVVCVALETKCRECFRNKDIVREVEAGRWPWLQ